MAIGYRSVLRLSDDDNAVKVAQDQVRSWLRVKQRKSRGRLNLADWEGPGVTELGSGTFLTVAEVADSRDGSRRQLIRLDETNPSGRWIVTVIASSRPNARRDKQVLCIELDKADASSEEALAAAKPPGLITHLLDSAKVRDSETVLLSAPSTIRLDNLDEVMDAICDDGRISSVVVATPPGGISDEIWRTTVRQLTRDSVGVAAVFVIAESAVDAFAGRLPPSHAVPRGSVRTFAPRVDLDDPADGIKHRVLGAKTFARSIRGGRVGGPLLVVHAQLARRRLVESDLPTDLRRDYDLLLKEEARITREAKVGRMAAASRAVDQASPASPDDISRPLGLTDWLRGRVAQMVRRWLGLEQVTPDSLTALDTFIVRSVDGYEVAREQIDSLLESRSGLAEEIQQLRDQVEEAELAASIESDAAREASREARILRTRLRETERHSDVFVGPEDVAYDSPSDIEDLLLRLDAEVSDNPVVSRVQFTGSISDAMEIAKRDPFGRVVNKMWEFVLILNDYAIAREAGYQGSMHHYLNDSEVTSRKCPVHRHAAGESEAVTSNPRMLAERVFNVPQTVDPSGKLAMLAHFKPTHSDTFAPRMYYLDDTSGTGKIYIGYIGRHLSNSKTN